MNKKDKIKIIRLIIALVLTVAIAVILANKSHPKWVEVLCYVIPYLVVGYDILLKAIKGIGKKQVFDENFLMAIASLGAFGLGECLESVAVMTFYQIGELFEHFAVNRSRQNISDLMDIRPDYANVYTDGQVQKVDPYEVEVGDTIIVNPGEKIPIDGIVTKGDSSVDTVALTGESVPRKAGVGDEVISGCINLSGVLEIETTKDFDESTVSKILELVENSSMRKAKAENFISKFAKYYTPVVCGLALALAVLPPLVLLVFGRDPMVSTWILRALTFLVISCPCALVISVPLSFFGGIGCASSKGILIKGSNFMETLSDIKTIVFDKTGTLTKGVFTVVEIEEEAAYRGKILEYAAYAEAASSHPIANSIKQSYGKRIDQSLVAGVEEIAGHGIKAIYDSKEIVVGNVKLMQKYGIEAYDCKKINIPEATIVYVVVDNEFAGAIAIADQIKEGAAEAIRQFHDQNISSIVLTGDSKSVARAVASKLGVDSYKAELLPGDKVEELERIIENTDGQVAFVGDGINDAPVIMRADIGIAMGSLGSDAAIEAADVVLIEDDVRSISLAKRIANKTLRIVRENIVFAIGIKVLFLLLGAIGIANMWMAIFADVGVMIIAVINSMRALRIK